MTRASLRGSLQPSSIATDDERKIGRVSNRSPLRCRHDASRRALSRTAARAGSFSAADAGRAVESETTPRAERTRTERPRPVARVLMAWTRRGWRAEYRFRLLREPDGAEDQGATSAALYRKPRMDVPRWYGPVICVALDVPAVGRSRPRRAGLAVS